MGIYDIEKFTQDITQDITELKAQLEDEKSNLAKSTMSDGSVLNANVAEFVPENKTNLTLRLNENNAQKIKTESIHSSNEIKDHELDTSSDEDAADQNKQKKEISKGYEIKNDEYEIDINTVFAKARKDPNIHSEEIDKLKQFVEDKGYDLTELQDLERNGVFERSYFEYNRSKDAKKTFYAVQDIVNDGILKRGSLDKTYPFPLPNENLFEYKTLEPFWNEKDCRANKNIFISKQCTNDLLKYIDESFEDNSKLYYYFDYTVAIQIIDKQTVCFDFINGRKICLMNIGFHKDGKDLYPVIVVNNHTKKTKQRWKVIDYDHISKAFMTADQLNETYGIDTNNLPKGSRAKHKNWRVQKDQIVINEDL